MTEDTETRSSRSPPLQLSVPNTPPAVVLPGAAPLLEGSTAERWALGLVPTLSPVAIQGLIRWGGQQTPCGWASPVSPHQDTGTTVEPCPSIWGQGRGGEGKGWEGTTSRGCREKQEGITNNLHRQIPLGFIRPGMRIKARGSSSPDCQGALTVCR